MYPVTGVLLGLLSLILTAIILYVTLGSSSNFHACGVVSDVSFNNFFGDIDSQAPLVYPTNDKELKKILRKARQHGCTVRPKGTGHSRNGVVMQKTESNTIVVSLAEYSLSETDASWSKSLDEVNAKYRAEGGTTVLDMMSVIRPRGFLLHSHTAGPFFSMAGMYMNPSVNGGAHDGQHLMNYVTGIRAMLSDGSIKYITEEEELVKWRGSLGMLGIVTALEVSIRPDTGLLLDTSETQLTSNTTNEDLEETFTNLKNDFDHSISFYTVYSDKMIHLTGTYSGGPAVNEEFANQVYAQLLAAQPDLAKTGGTEIEPQDTSILLGPGQFVRQIAEGAARQVEAIFPYIYWTNADAANDMFFLPGSHNKYEESTWAIPRNNFVVAFQAYRNLIQTLINNPAASFYPNLPAEFRFVNVPDVPTSIWQTLPPGDYVVFEQVHLKDPALNVHRAWFKEFEQLMIQNGGIPHHGKGYGLGSVGDLPAPYFFQDEVATDKFYSTEVQRNVCLDAMLEYDPNGLFRGGAVLESLGQPDAVTYEPRGKLSQSCQYYEDAECISGCCSESEEPVCETC